MSDDRGTLDFYNGAAVTYADRFASDPRPDADLTAFLARLPEGGRVLDLGCGPGRSARLMLDAGFAVDASDGSEGMIRTARERFGITAQHETFEMLDAISIFDGIWANFSLLHAPRDAMPANLLRIHRALKPGGILHLGLKLGEGEERDTLGRFYSYFTESQLEKLLADAGYSVISKRVFEVEGMTGAHEPAIIVHARA